MTLVSRISCCVAMFVLVAGTIGCAPQGPYRDPGAMGLAPDQLARLDVPGSSRHFERVHIISCDGQKIRSTKSVELAPGVHSVGLSFSGRDWEGNYLFGGLGGARPMVLKFEAQAGKRYHVFFDQHARRWSAGIAETLTGTVVTLRPEP